MFCVWVRCVSEIYWFLLFEFRSTLPFNGDKYPCFPQSSIKNVFPTSQCSGVVSAGSLLPVRYSGPCRTGYSSLRYTEAVRMWELQMTGKLSVGLSAASLGTYCGGYCYVELGGLFYQNKTIISLTNHTDPHSQSAVCYRSAGINNTTRQIVPEQQPHNNAILAWRFSRNVQLLEC